MKNKFIEQKLNIYAEAVKPGTELISGAFTELRQNRARAAQYPYAYKKPRNNFLIIGTVAAAAVWLVLISIGLYFFATLNSGENYSLSTLSYQVSSIEKGRENSVLIMDIGEAYTNVRMYYNKSGDKPLVISVLYKTVGGGGLDEIVVIADLGGGLKDYAGFKNYTKAAVGGTTVCQREIMQNGEYYSEIFFSFKKIDYYIKIASPISGGINYYLPLLLEA
jgi:hypothetical protein